MKHFADIAGNQKQCVQSIMTKCITTALINIKWDLVKLNWNNAVVKHCTNIVILQINMVKMYNISINQLRDMIW